MLGTSDQSNGIEVLGMKSRNVARPPHKHRFLSLTPYRHYLSLGERGREGAETAIGFATGCTKAQGA